MQMGEAIRAIVGIPGAAVVRPGGTMLALHGDLVVKALGRNGWHKWTPKFADLAAYDWTPMTPEVFKKYLDELAEREAAAEAAAQGQAG